MLLLLRADTHLSFLSSLLLILSPKCVCVTIQALRLLIDFTYAVWNDLTWKAIAQVSTRRLHLAKVLA